MIKKAIAVGLVIIIACVIVKVAIDYNKYTNGEIRFTINNNEVDCNSISEIKDYIEKMTITTLDNIDISSAVVVEADTNYIDNISFIDYMQIENVNIAVKLVDINKDKVKEILKEYNSKQSECSDAYISQDETHYIVVSEQYGGKVAIEKILTDLNIDNITNIKLSNYLEEPNIKSDVFKDIVAEANKYIDWHVNYENGQSFTGNIQYVKLEDNQVILDDSFIYDIIKQLEKEYDKTGEEREFITSDNETITVSGGTWGTIMSSKNEKETLIEMFNNAQSDENRKPIMIQDYTEIGNTYIELSIQKQHLWVYIDGVLELETDVVTGDALRGRDTPTGIYFISECIDGKYLRGDGYVTWVNKWMRLTNSGVGLHDAYWKSRFGGNYYKGDGSHGCINLPTSFAYELFPLTYVGMPVVIY